MAQPSASSCLPCCPWRGFGPCSVLALVRDHPHLVNTTTFRYPSKTFALLMKTDAAAVRQLCDDLPAETLQEVLPELLQSLRYRKFVDVVVPLLSDPAVVAKLTVLLRVLHIETIIEIVNAVTAKKLAIVLRAPVDSLTSLIAAVEPGCVSPVLIPVLQEPDSLVESSLVPLLAKVKQPERIAFIVNQAEPDVLLWLLRGVSAEALASILNALSTEDFQENGAAVVLLQELADNRGLVKEKVLPLLAKGEPEKIARLVQGIKAPQLLQVLRSVEAEGVIRLLENTNAELVVRLFNGPLDSAIAVVAGSVAEVMRLPEVAELLKVSTDHLQVGLSKADDVMSRGQQARGSEGGDGYQFGDFTRGLIAMTKEDVQNIARIGKLATGSQDDGSYSFADLTRGLVEKDKERWESAAGFVKEGWEAITKRKQSLEEQMASQTEALEHSMTSHLASQKEAFDGHMRKMSESIVDHSKRIQKGIEIGKEKMSALSCTSATSHQRGDQAEMRF